MEKETIPVLKYKEVLENIENQENHLLLGNGFNRSLGVNTSYRAIFQKMIESKHGLYKDVIKLAEDCNYDLEYFIGKLEADIDDQNVFLKKYVRNKIKIDFMQATHEIVKFEIKNVYAEHNEGVYLLLKNFTNYFTLNYDSFLYLLLLNFKSSKNNDDKAIVFEPSIKFIEEDMNEWQNHIYSEIRQARENGKLELDFRDDINKMEKSFNKMTRSHFEKEIKEYSKTNNKGWKTKDIERAIKYIFEEEKRNLFLQKVDDGSRQLKLFGDEWEFVFDVNSRTQNLFFLHGAFHIFKDGQREKKITQQSDKALYERLENILNNEEQEIVCVFQSNNKINAIKESGYLMNCLKKLGNLSGNMVIIGSSLADNDNHIFEQINKSSIDNIYISTILRDKEKNQEAAKNKFPSKNIFLFEAESISYELPDEALN